MNEIEHFLKSICVVDTETTHVEYDLADIIELGVGTFDIDSKVWRTESALLGTVDPIPPESSAIHHISNKMIRGLPTFDDRVDELFDMIKKYEFLIAHNSDFDRIMLKKSFMESPNFSKSYHLGKSNTWICTWRLSKAIYGVDYTQMKHGLSYLRYYLNLEIDDSVDAHRAAADVLVCGKLLERLIEDGIDNDFIDPSKRIGPQLNDLCWLPVKIKTWPFGKHKGSKLEDIPNDYYSWAIENMDVLNENNARFDKDLAWSVEKILEQRLN